MGKSMKLRCFKVIESFSVEYTANMRNWKTKKFFEDWLKRENEIVEVSLLVWDNVLRIPSLDKCTGQPKIDLTYVKLKFLPPICNGWTSEMERPVY